MRVCRAGREGTHTVPADSGLLQLAALEARTHPVLGAELTPVAKPWTTGPKLRMGPWLPAACCWVGGRLGDPGNTRAGQSVWDSTTIPGGGSQVLRGPRRSPRTVNSPSVRRDSRMVEQRKTQVIRLAWAPSPGVPGAHVTSNQLFSFLCLSCLLFQIGIRKAGLTTLLCNTVRSHM